MRVLWVSVLLLACQGHAVVSASSSGLEGPESVKFAQTALTFSQDTTVTVVNLSRVPKTVQVSAATPFSAAPTLEVPGASEASLTVTFTPKALGVATGVLELDGLQVRLEGEGVTAPTCGAPAACAAERYDPATNAWAVPVMALGTQVVFADTVNASDLYLTTAGEALYVSESSPRRGCGRCTLPGAR